MINISEGVNVQYSSTAHYDDDVQSFFVHCHHMKDWIKNDDSIEIYTKEVDDYINKNRELCICADLCNGIKHLKLNKKIRSEKEPKFVNQKETTITVYPYPQGGATYKTRYEIDSDIGLVDARNLAEKCIQLWKIFLVNKGMSV